MKNRLTIAAVILALFAVIVPAAFAQEEEPPHWGYEGEHGPDHWAELEEDFALCSAGHSQSPIDVSGATDVGLSDIAFHYGETPLSVLNNGHTIQVNVEPGSTITYNGRDYALLQFHFHHPSEHTVNGEAAPMEIHFVHSADGDLAVVGVMLVADEMAAEAYAPIFANLPAEAETTVDTDITLNLTDLLPAETTFTTYSGSLTTPPCSEGVRWLVLDEPVALTDAEIEAFAALFELNARPVQPLNDRDLLHDVDA